MTNIALIAALFSTLNFSSACGFRTLKVRPGEDVTLQCANFTDCLSHVFWFKLSDGPNVSSITSMRSSDSNVTLHNDFKSGKFNMSSDSVTLKLTIKQVNSTDSGLYFCGFTSNNNPVIRSATSLIVEVSQTGVTVLDLIVGTLITVLIGVIAVLSVKIKKLQKAARTKEDLGSDVLNYASLDFQEAKRRRRTPAEDQPEMNVVYATTR